MYQSKTTANNELKMALSLFLLCGGGIAKK